MNSIQHIKKYNKLAITNKAQAQKYLKHLHNVQRKYKGIANYTACNYAVKNMQSANNNLSKCASALYKAFSIHAYEDEDLHAYYAPSECYTLVHKQQIQQIKNILAKHNYTAKQFITALEERTSAKFVYFNFLQVLNLT